jgi:hypothetical protein
MLGTDWSGTNLFDAAKLPGLRLKDANQDPKMRCDANRKYIAIPQPGERMPPLTGQNLVQASKYLELLRSWTKEDPSLQQAVVQFEKMTSGSSFVATEFWNESRQGQQSMSEHQASRKIGGCLNTAVLHQRRKKLFGETAKGVKANLHSKASIRQAYQLNQSAMRKPYPPRLAGVSGPLHFREQIIAMIEKCMTEEISLPAPSGSKPEEFQISPSVMITKADDVLQEKARHCIDLSQANDPVKLVFVQPQFPKATKVACALLNRHDLLSLVDAKSGYNQVALNEASCKLQCWTVQRDLFDAAMTNLHLPHSHTTTHWIMTVGKEEVVVMMPTCLQFGSSPSRALFEEQFQQPIRFLRTNFGVRAASQVDDLMIFEHQGPAASFMRIAMILPIYHYVGWQLHMNGSKAAGLWPASHADFNGFRYVPEIMYRFVPPPRAQVVQQTAQALVRDITLGIQVDNRRVAQVVGQNRACDAHYPTPLWLAEPQGALTASIKAAMKGKPEADPYGQPFTGFSPLQMRHLKALAQAKTIGSPVRAHGAPMMTATADASEHSFGGLAVNHETQEVITTSAPLLAWVQEKWHTHKEGHAVWDWTITARRYFNLTAPMIRPRPVAVQSDNQAVVANGNAPKGKAEMVNPMIKAKISLVAAGLVPVVSYVPKEFMDDETKIDEYGRKTYTQDDLGLKQAYVIPALLAVDSSWQAKHWVDVFACRSTHQPWCKEWIGRWPNHEALPQPDFLSYNLHAHPDLVNKALFIHPPSPLIWKVIQKLIDQPRDAVLMVPLFVEKPHWWNLLVEVTEAYAVIQVSSAAWLHPGGQANTNEKRTDRCSRILCRLSAERCLSAQDPLSQTRLREPTCQAVLHEQLTTSSTCYSVWRSIIPQVFQPLSLIGLRKLPQQQTKH